MRLVLTTWYSARNAMDPKTALALVTRYLADGFYIHTVDAAVLHAFMQINPGAYDRVWCASPEDPARKCVQLTTLHDADWLASYNLVDLYLQGAIVPAAELPELPELPETPA